MKGMGSAAGNRLDELFDARDDYDIVVRVIREEDIVVARQMAKQMAQDAGFSLADTTKVATAVSELARNIYRYAREGKIFMRKTEEQGVSAIEIKAVDKGPGIEDIDLVLTKGYSTFERSLGIGLSGVKRLMDDFEIVSYVGKGTVVFLKMRSRKI